jgi:type VI protein secretion system component Hcp
MNTPFRMRSAVLACFGVAVMAPAIAGSIYLKIPNVTGPVTRSGFLGDVELTAYSQSFTNPASMSSGGGGSAGRVSCGAINITKAVDVTSQNFLEYVTRGTNIHTLTVYFTGGNPNSSAATSRYSIVLTNVRVTSVAQGDMAKDSSSALGLTENISLMAEKFQVTYTTSNPDASNGNTETYGWDCATNSAT